MSENTHRFDLWKQCSVKRTQRELSDCALHTMELLEKAAGRARELAEAFAGDTNPQVVESRIRKEAEAEMLETVLRSLRGDSVELRIVAGV